MNNLKIRFIKSEDIKSLLTFYTKDRDYPKKPRKMDYDEDDIDSYIKSDHCKIVVAKIDNDVVAYSIFYDLITWGYIDEICVNKSHRNIGVGTKIFKWIEKKYKNKWYCIEIAAHAENTEMIKYLTKLGFITDDKLVWKFKVLK